MPDVIFLIEFHVLAEHGPGYFINTILLVSENSPALNR